MSLKRSAFKIKIVFCHCHSCVCHVVIVVGTTTRMVALHSLCRSVTPTNGSTNGNPCALEVAVSFITNVAAKKDVWRSSPPSTWM